MIEDWFSSTGVTITELATNFITYLQSDNATANGAIEHTCVEYSVCIVAALIVKLNRELVFISTKCFTRLHYFT
jgi:hypothetical protein